MVPLSDFQLMIDVEGNLVQRFSLFPAVGQTASAEPVRWSRRHLLDFTSLSLMFFSDGGHLSLSCVSGQSMSRSSFHAMKIKFPR